MLKIATQILSEILLFYFSPTQHPDILSLRRKTLANTSSPFLWILYCRTLVLKFYTILLSLS